MSPTAATEAANGAMTVRVWKVDRHARQVERGKRAGDGGDVADGFRRRERARRDDVCQNRDKDDGGEGRGDLSVSYTHLTLPTKA